MGGVVSRVAIGLRTDGKRALHQVGLATATARPLPEFLVIGAKRGGTTSVWNYLLMHPQVLPMFPAREHRKSTHYFFKSYSRGPLWYRSHFATAASRCLVRWRLGVSPICGEASPYYLYHPFSPGRIQQLLPQVRAIVPLRDPVRRAYSNYWERFDQGVEPLSFEEALAAEPQRLARELERMNADPLYYSKAHDFFAYRDRGVYAPQLRRWLELFPREQLLVLRSEDFYSDPQQVFDEIVRFLGLRPYRLASVPRLNYRPARTMDPATRAELQAFYRPHNEELYELLGRDMGWEG